MATIFVDVVSAEESIFSGEASFVALPGQEGELGILPGHVPLLTRIRPGAVRITTTEGAQENVFVAGGILEVQPTAPRRRATWRLPSSKRPWQHWLHRSPTSSACVTDRAQRREDALLGEAAFSRRILVFTRCVGEKAVFLLF